jgi:hypothetical protein
MTLAYLKLTGDVVVYGESAGGYKDIGTRRVFKCESCKRRQVRVAHREYVRIGDDVKTRFNSDEVNLKTLTTTSKMLRYDDVTLRF